MVDETAHIDKAARHIVLGASTDNNIICVDEKEVIVVSSVADALIRAMQTQGAVLIDRSRLTALENLVFAKHPGPRGHGAMNHDLIGKNASVILRQGRHERARQRAPGHRRGGRATTRCSGASR